MKDAGTFISPEEANSRAGDDGTGKMEGEAELETSHCNISSVDDTGEDSER